MRPLKVSGHQQIITSTQYRSKLEVAKKKMAQNRCGAIPEFEPPSCPSFVLGVPRSTAAAARSVVVHRLDRRLKQVFGFEWEKGSLFKERQPVFVLISHVLCRGSSLQSREKFLCVCIYSAMYEHTAVVHAQAAYGLLAVRLHREPSPACVTPCVVSRHVVDYLYKSTLLL